ncbi:MAG: MFS transporter [Thermodesulfobacteriota bacterium]
MEQKIKKPKIFYGWYILAIGMVGAFVAAGTSQLFMSIMIKPLTKEFGWSRTAATGAITAGTIIAGLLSLPFGKLADRYGPRWLTSLGALVVAGAYFGFTKFVNLWQFYAIYVIARAVSTNTLSIITPQTAAVNWFRRYRGRALGLLSMSPAFGISVLAMIAQFIMERYGWRAVFMTFALGMMFLQVIPAALVLRRRPEDIGLVPDGIESARVESVPAGQSVPKGEVACTLKEAIRTGALWCLIIANMVASIVASGLGFHLVAYLTDIGIAPSVAVGAIGIYALTGAVGNVIWGFLSEKVSERLLASGVMLLMAATILYLQSVRTVTGVFIFVILFGAAARGEGTLVNIILAQYYGRNSYGAISGFNFPFHMVGLGFGPLVSSFSFDLTGSYQALFYVFTGVSVIAAFLLWLAKKPTLARSLTQP